MSNESTPNIPRLTRLAEWLEAGAMHETMTFDINTGITIKASTYNRDEPTECGTSCCIAGAAVQFFDKGGYDDMVRNFPVDPEYPDDHDENSLSWTKIFANARDLLGLTTDQAALLFVPDNDPEKPSIFAWSDELEKYNDPAWAARTIRHFIATGEMDWEAVK